jgi:Calpain family cysteine protease
MATSIRELQAYGVPPDRQPSDPAGGPPADPEVAARLERAEAATRLAAFAAGDDHGNDHVLARPYEAEIANAVLFAKQPGDATAVDAADVRQHRFADCSLLAPLAAMARTTEGRAFLQHAVVENRSEEGRVVSYTVNLHVLQHGRFGRITARDVPVTVGPRFVLARAGARAADGHNEVWPLVVEKACADLLGGYARIDRPGDPADALRLLTGHEPSYFPLGWLGRWMRPYSESTLKADLDGGKFVILGARDDIAEPTGNPATETARGLVASHAYYAEGIEERDGKTFVRLGNPWPDAKPVLIPFDELPRWFSGVHVGSLR